MRAREDFEVLISGVSADYVHGFERFNVQNVSRPGGIEPCGSADDLGGLEEERWWDGQA
jgi:hypothetical protein